MSISGPEKVAILMMMLKDDNVIKEIFNRLDQNEIYAVSLAMTNLGDVSSETVEKVLIEFAHDLNQSLQLVGNVKTAERFLKRVLSENEYTKLIEKIKHANVNSTWELIGNMDDISIAQFLKHEYPQTTALILSKLSGFKSAKILKLLSKEYAVEVLRRMMSLDAVQPETLSRVEKVIESEMYDLSSHFNRGDNVNIVAEIFNNFSKDDENFFMGALRNKDPEAADKVAKAMFTFEDLLLVGEEGIQAIIKQVDNNTLVAALSGASDSIRNLFLNTMSQRVARMITDEIEIGARYSKKDILEAQNKVLKIVKKLMADEIMEKKQVQ